MNIKIIVAAHKPYRMPDDEMYLPLHVGRAGKEDISFRGDDTGDNISGKNPNFCELTGLYWAWKNLDAEYIGLAHYRRHFSVKKKKDKFESILTKSQLENLLKYKYAVLPKPRNYYIETIYSHYAHTFDAAHLDKTKEIIAEKYPEYIPAFEKVMNSKKAHMFNMFIMKKELADKYCEWLFDILFELEKVIDTANMTAFEARLFGRVSERLLDVWVITNDISYFEIGHIHMEKIDWIKKISGFLSAKLLGKKYDKSF
ncbi:MAG: DUF4422 domain-containing protein [Ruminococcus sp.]|nr:DUF4422 domain-containing protein [Ruminococcus sp.]